MLTRIASSCLFIFNRLRIELHILSHLTKNVPPPLKLSLLMFYLILIHLLSLPKTNYHLIEKKLTYLIDSGLWLESLLFCFEYLLQSWVVANHKSSKCLISNGNPHELPVRNLLNPSRKERLLYLRVLALFFCILVFLYCTFLTFLLENNRHNILFIRKPKNLINRKYQFIS